MSRAVVHIKSFGSRSVPVIFILRCPLISAINLLPLLFDSALRGLLEFPFKSYTPFSGSCLTRFPCVTSFFPLDNLALCPALLSCTLKSSDNLHTTWKEWHSLHFFFNWLTVMTIYDLGIGLEVSFVKLPLSSVPVMARFNIENITASLSPQVSSPSSKSSSPSSRRRRHQVCSLLVHIYRINQTILRAKGRRINVGRRRKLFDVVYLVIQFELDELGHMPE